METKPLNRREQSKARTRTMILRSAYELFEEKGYEATTMRALAARAGVGLGTIFQHFPDKSSLLITAFTEDLTQTLFQSFTTLPQEGIKEQLLHLVRGPLEFYAARPRLAQVILKEGFFADNRAAQELRDHEALISGGLAQLFVAAMERGELRPDMDPDLAVTALWASYFYTLRTSLQSGDFDVERQLSMLGRLLDQLMTGINGRAEP